MEANYLCSKCNQPCEPDVTPDIDRSGDVYPACHRFADLLQGDSWCDGPLRINHRHHSICVTCERCTTEPKHRPCITMDQWDELVEQYWQESDILDAENRGRAWGGLEE